MDRESPISEQIIGARKYVAWFCAAVSLIAAALALHAAQAAEHLAARLG